MYIYISIYVHTHIPLYEYIYIYIYIHIIPPTVGWWYCEHAGAEVVPPWTVGRAVGGGERGGGGGGAPGNDIYL